MSEVGPGPENEDFAVAERGDSGPEDQPCVVAAPAQVQDEPAAPAPDMPAGRQEMAQVRDAAPAPDAAPARIQDEPAPAQGMVAADLETLREIDGRLADVDRALQRLDDGTYWTCESCGTVIDEKLLTEAPLRRRCARCDPVGAGRPGSSEGRLFP